MDINHLSVSRAQTWNTCQESYKFRYHLKMASPEPEPIYFAYGKLVHKIAEAYVKTAGQRPIQEVATDFIQHNLILEQQQVLPADYCAKLPKHLQAIASLTKRTGFGGFLEYPFEYDLDPPHQRCLVGFIDRLICQGDSYWVLDYKTTQKGPYRKNSASIRHDLQLRCYAKVVQRDFGAKAENIRCGLYYVEGAELVAVTFSQESLDKTEADFRALYKKIEATPPEQAWGRVGHHCQRCDYRSVCNYFRSAAWVDL